MNWRSGIVYILILAVAAVLILNIFPGRPAGTQITLSKLVTDIRQGLVEKIVVEGDQLSIQYRDDDEKVESRKETGVELTETLLAMGLTAEDLGAIDLEVTAPSAWTQWLTILGSFLPFIFLAILFLFLMRQAQGTNNQALSFGKSRARMFTGEKPTVTFEDVAGVEEAKEELKEIVEFLREPQKFISLGARIPKGVILMGAPGTGKTLMAKAVSGEAGVPFFSISGSEFVEMFVGVGASRVRDLFDQAKRNSPCIVFIDEIDAVGRHRGAGLGGSHDEREQTLNQILVEMDGFDTDTNIIIVAATNRPDILDPALLRPGRFDRRVVLDRPDMNGRKKILEIHVRGKPLERAVDLEKLAQQTPGFVGADIENFVNEAAILAARRNKKAIGMDEFQEAIERVIAGPERRSRLITDEEKRVIAYHEAGHALVAAAVPDCDVLHKVSIVARGMAGGYTITLPEEDRYLHSRTKLLADLALMLGGRAAEELVFEHVTTGASNDLERATDVARRMVMEFGMSQILGPMTFGERDELVFLGREIAEHRNYGEDVARQIDQEVQRFITRAYEQAKQVLLEQRERLDALAEALIRQETLEGPALDAILAGIS